MSWATLPSAFIPLSWIHLKDLSCPVLSNIPRRQKLLSPRAPWHYYASLVPALQTAVQNPPQPVPCTAHPFTQLLRQWSCQPVPSLSCLQFIFSSHQPGTILKSWKCKELLWDCRYPFALQSPSCQPKLGTKDQGTRILAWDTKPSTTVVISYCHTLDKSTSFDLTL